jgi:hypothetical protein
MANALYVSFFIFFKIYSLSRLQLECWSVGLPWREAAWHQKDLRFLAKLYVKCPICLARSGPGSNGCSNTPLFQYQSEAILDL